jgi:hypothetical protein
LWEETYYPETFRTLHPEVYTSQSYFILPFRCKNILINFRNYEWMLMAFAG